MYGQIDSLVSAYGMSLAEILPVAGVGLGALLAVLGISGLLSGKDPVLQRIAAQGGSNRSMNDMGILREADGAPTGLSRAYIPTDEGKRTAIQRQLSAAGYRSPRAVRMFFLARLVLGLFLPVLIAGLVIAAYRGAIALPLQLDLAIGRLSQIQLIQIVSLAILFGFFGPTVWLRGRIAERQRAISEAFPNALDLIQISVEAGLGFDAAMIRVGNELEKTAPALSEELLTAQREIQAGRARDKALTDMAARTAVDEVAAFVNVVLQSIQFGTSISGTLSAYAREMRQTREVRAQEKANKLPVQMSAIMASLMLPALLLLTLGPVVIRYTHYFAG